MNSDSCEQEEHDAYDHTYEITKPTKKIEPPYPTSSYQKPDLSIWLQPIPTQLFLPYSKLLENGARLYCNKSLDNQIDRNVLVFFCIHGAGQSALVYGQLAKQMKDDAILFTYDIMCHGSSQSALSENEITIQNILNESKEVLEYITNQLSFRKIILIGHSVGGAIATKLAYLIQTSKIRLQGQIAGVVMIDTIEGLARKSTGTILTFLKERPQSFQSLESAIKWNYKAGCVRRLESARFSVPSFFKKQKQNNRYRWRTNLLETQLYWDGWFQGTSQIFIHLNCKTILMTSTKFRLDESLLRGLDQNRFKLQLFDFSGHNIQQDQYEKVNRILQESFAKSL